MNIKYFLLAITTLLMMGYMTFASAGSLRCGVHLIQDSQIKGPGKYQILKKCGEPASRFGNTWIYEINGKTYILIFNDNGQLSSIKR